MNSNLRTLLPVNAEPVRSSRFIQMRLPAPQRADALGSRCKGVGSLAKFRRGGYSIRLNANRLQRTLRQHGGHMNLLKLQLYAITNRED